jgi:hypothetical protein
MNGLLLCDETYYSDRDKHKASACKVALRSRSIIKVKTINFDNLEND